MEHETKHPFEKRGIDLRRLLFDVITEDGVSWERVMEAGELNDYKSETMRRAVNEGVAYGAFYKTGGRRENVDALVRVTHLGKLAKETLLEDPLVFCPHDDLFEHCPDCGGTPIGTTDDHG